MFYVTVINLRTLSSNEKGHMSIQEAGQTGVTI